MREIWNGIDVAWDSAEIAPGLRLPDGAAAAA
ncbi:hypothetical protein BY998_104195 [Methylobacterium sp. B4]|nr:hypothetical protein BY998_104195 [Methylobacterium sp. B4]